MLLHSRRALLGRVHVHGVLGQLCIVGVQVSPLVVIALLLLNRLVEGHLGERLARLTVEGSLVCHDL